MLSRSQAKAFFIGGTFITGAVFVGLTVDTFQQIPKLTNAPQLDEEVAHGKELFDKHNCMGCHTILGEGGYYAPELTKVYERRGPSFIRAMLDDPQAMYPGQRKMVDYDFTDDEEDALIAYFEWVGKMDLNGFPPKPVLFEMAPPDSEEAVATQRGRPKVFNQMCVACHSLNGQGGKVGPALDGIGDRMTMDELEPWLKNPQQVRPGTKMPDLPLTEEQVRELAAFLSTLKNGEDAQPKPTGGA